MSGQREEKEDSITQQFDSDSGFSTLSILSGSRKTLEHSEKLTYIFHQLIRLFILVRFPLELSVGLNEHFHNQMQMEKHDFDPNRRSLGFSKCLW